jgi:hypothetical protein
MQFTPDKLYAVYERPIVEIDVPYSSLNIINSRDVIHAANPIGCILQVASLFTYLPFRSRWDKTRDRKSRIATGDYMRTPPLDFLLGCSNASLQDFELSRRNQANNIRKQILVTMDELRQVDAEADLARWLMEHRSELLAAGASLCTCKSQHSFEFPASPRSVEPQPRRKALGA